MNKVYGQCTKCGCDITFENGAKRDTPSVGKRADEGFRFRSVCIHCYRKDCKLRARGDRVRKREREAELEREIMERQTLVNKWLSHPIIDRARLRSKEARKDSMKRDSLSSRFVLWRTSQCMRF